MWILGLKPQWEGIKRMEREGRMRKGGEGGTPHFC